MEVRSDLRLMTLAAALAAASPRPDAPEHPLVVHTRENLRPFAGHPAALWLRDTSEQAGLLGLGMQAVQLAGPPDFRPAPVEEVPAFVRECFSEVAADELSHKLRAFWAEARLDDLFSSQRPLWDDAVADLESVLAPVDLIAFQARFFGHYPYHLVAVPLASMPTSGLRGIGLANRRETYAACLPVGGQPYGDDPVGLLVLAQHEASHPILGRMQRQHPQVPRRCGFVEEAFPPGERFARRYPDPESRWIETLIRTSSYFFLRSLGRPDEAERFLRAQVAEGVRALDLFVIALQPWWQERTHSGAEGMDGVLDELPAWLEEARSELEPGP